MLRKIFTSNKYLLIITILLSVFALPIIYKSTSFIRETHKLNCICVSINTINLSLNSSLTNGTLNTSCAETQLKKGLKDFNSLSKKLSSTKVSSKNNPTKDKINQAIYYNISLYNLALYLIQKPTDDNSNNNMIELNKTLKLVEDCNNNLRSFGLSSTFSDISKTYFQTTLSYANSEIIASYNQDIYVAQMKSFYNSTEECLSLFDNIDEDLQPALNKIREDGRSLDVLLIDIKSKKNSLSLLKTKAVNISIPSKCSDIYNDLQDLINSYDLYISSLQDSIIAEKNSNHKSNISDNYVNSFSKYKTFIGKLNDLKSKLDSFKNSI